MFIVASLSQIPNASVIKSSITITQLGAVFSFSPNTTSSESGDDTSSPIFVLFLLCHFDKWGGGSLAILVMKSKTSCLSGNQLM